MTQTFSPERAMQRRKREGNAMKRMTEKQKLIDQIVNWRKQMKGSISPQNHRRLLNTWSTADLKRLWERVQTGEGTALWKQLTEGRSDLTSGLQAGGSIFRRPGESAVRLVEV